DSGCRASVALNFATPIGSLEDILGEFDQVLIMSVDPGFGGQAFIPGTLAKIERMRRMLDEAESPAELAVDGGIKPENIGRIAAAGATIAVTGSAVFAPHHAPAEGLNKLREALSQARR
ncbi:MAG: ribulose-phosphate 3-epimerase, partial [Chloroflexota bacterium]